MKKSVFALAFLAGAAAMAAPSYAEEDQDPGVTSIIQELSNKFEEATGRPFDQATKDEYRLTLLNSLLHIIKNEGECYDIAYGVHKDGVDLRAYEDICLENGSFVSAPRERQLEP